MEIYYCPTGRLIKILNMEKTEKHSALKRNRTKTQLIEIKQKTRTMHRNKTKKHTKQITTVTKINNTEICIVTSTRVDTKVIKLLNDIILLKQENQYRLMMTLLIKPIVFSVT